MIGIFYYRCKWLPKSPMTPITIRYIAIIKFNNRGITNMRMPASKETNGTMVI